ncbi:DUF4238 domain-containing protein [Rathayibacter sp. AY1D5]|uniref:DUF4238 domain-containing protein n=1 Tax=Rathayibacter sp. AY1D5 TaxID=2080546 RepID=UPI000CE73531|nr:DUF4238 domain-containing protein [Rathayibacter sp. AY1D5]PPH89826.1 hypothetical protein C5C82_07150 [Rathayibacter sp. AY1D5]
MTKVPQRPKRHHVVSAFYLRGFADERDQLQCAPRDGSPEFRTAVGNATVHTDFYTFDDTDGEPSGDFEDWMAGIERDAAPVLLSLVAGNAPPPVGDERMALAGWIALQYLRTESQRAMMSQLDALVRTITEQRPGVFRPEPVAEAVRHAPTSANAASEPHLDQTRMLMPLFAAVIMASPWVISHFTDDYLITGDHPVHLMAHPDAGNNRPLAFGTARALALPLSRRASLIAVTSQPAKPPTDPPPEDGSADEARYMNLQTILNTRRLVLRHPDDPLPIPVAEFPPPQTDEVAFTIALPSEQ